jgi:four helix bundle protein
MRALGEAITSDPLWQIAAYRKALAFVDVARSDATIIGRSRVYEATSRQLFRAVASIPANIAEGYSRSTGLDRARFFEYALGSSRESLVWYYAGQTMLTEELLRDRAFRIVELRRLLISSVRRERDRRRVPSVPWRENR